MCSSNCGQDDQHFWWRHCRSRFNAVTSSTPMIFPMSLLPQGMMKTSGTVLPLEGWWDEGEQGCPISGQPSRTSGRWHPGPSWSPMVSLALSSPRRTEPAHIKHGL